MGWEPVAFSEIEKFPSAVLAHHYPNVPNWGDMTKFKEWPDACHCVQAGTKRSSGRIVCDDRNSADIAGSKQWVNDGSSSGNYSKGAICEVCNGTIIDVLVGGTPCQSFSVAGLRKGLDDPRGNLMLTFGSIAQRYCPQWLVWENVPGVLSSNGGRDFGSFLGMLGQLGYGFAYRVLDAQYCGVAQRRRRVFVVGHLGDWHRAAAVLFERHSLSGHPAPSRQARKGTAGGVAPGATASGWPAEVSPTLNAHFGSKQGLEDQHIAGGGDYLCQPVANCLTQRMHKGINTTLDEGQTPIVTIGGGFDAVAIQDVRAVEKAQNGKGWNDDGSAYTVDTHATQGVAVAIQGTVIGRSEHAGPQGSGADASGAMFTLTKTDVHAVAFGVGEQSEIGHCLRSGASKADKHESTTYVQTAMQVRRLTPVECERLQGFPDGYTNIPWRNKPESPDGPRYKALGNSMAVPVMRWIGERINEVSKL
jgi:DNA (cytosine-5)-methyltransferase 1